MKRTTSHKIITVSPISKAKASTKSQQPTKSRTTSVKKSTTKPSKIKSTSTSTRPKTVQPSKTKTQPTSSTQINTTTTKAKQLSTQTTSKIDSSKELVGVAPAERKTDKYQSMTQLEKETTEGVDWRKGTKDTGNQVLIVGSVWRKY